MKAVKKLQSLPLFLSLFLIFAAIITLLSGLVFITGQQIYRQSANDPQIQISEDMASFLSGGGDIKSVLPKSEVDIAKSLVWFVIAYNDAGEVVSSNAKLNGQVPVLPKGVLEHAGKNGQHRVTWEPQDDVRIAAVITKYNGGSVLVGRSLRETEERIEKLHKKTAMVWILTLALTFVGTWLLIPKTSH